MEKATHVAFSDESNYNKNKGFASICLVSLKERYIKELNSELKKILDESGTGEFKWNFLKGAKYRFCGEKILKFIFKHKDKLRIDILIWNLERRKKISNENNLLSFKKMYFQLFKNVLKKRWADDSEWILYPDEQSAMDWNESKNILDNVSMELIFKGDNEKISELNFKNFFKIHQISEINSRENPFCQIADLFSGMACFSYNNPSHSNCSSSQKLLSEEKINDSVKEKANLLDYFKRLTKINNVEIIFDKGLRTLNPNKDFINFWNFKIKDYSKKEESLKKWF